MFLLLGVDGDDEGGNLPSSIKPVKGEPPITKFDGDIMVMRWNVVTKTKSENFQHVINNPYNWISW